MTTRSTLLRNDNFIEAVVSAAHREVIELSEEHIFFNGPDPQVMIHIWRKDGFYFSGTSERNYRPGGEIRANDLTTVKQWLVMELFDHLRLSLHLEDIGIAFRWLSPAPHWSRSRDRGTPLRGVVHGHHREHIYTCCPKSALVHEALTRAPLRDRQH